MKGVLRRERRRRGGTRWREHRVGVAGGRGGQSLFDCGNVRDVCDDAAPRGRLHQVPLVHVEVKPGACFLELRVEVAEEGKAAGGCVVTHHPWRCGVNEGGGFREPPGGSTLIRYHVRVGARLRDDGSLGPENLRILN
ncbi:MAG: hypothetical protein SGPRY_011521 [Prymnesium sp.]